MPKTLPPPPGPVFVSVADFDNLILLIWATVVFFMQAGFAMLEAGAVEKHLSVNILFKNLVDSSIVAIAFWAVGYGLAFGSPSNGFAGLGEFFLIDVEICLSSSSSTRSR